MIATALPDTQNNLLLRLLPGSLRPFALLARFDRPIGWWLLFWPCAAGVALAGGLLTHWALILWMLLGAIAMRGAGCVYNDIVDRDLDAQVARTALRPLPSGSVSLRAAWAWLFVLCGVGLLVLVQLPTLAQLVALVSLVFVAAYPFMKRITWWPQAWLGLVFGWGALVGWFAVDTVRLPSAATLTLACAALYLGCIFWVIGYDTIYAAQDVEDDAIVGIRSSARVLGKRLRIGVTLFYLTALLAWSAALWIVRPDPLALVTLVPLALHLSWQAATVDPQNGRNALARFRSNRTAGLLLFLACATVGTSV